MKKIMCEMCGSTELVKQDGMYVCQACGTKYSVEEAKKLMIEGTVKVDNSEKLKNYYTLARQAKDSNDYENAVKYYGLIKQEDPNSWEACFYNVYYRASQTTIFYIQSAANSIKDILDTVFDLIKNGADSDDEKKKHVSEVALHVTLICTLLANSAKSTLVKNWSNSNNFPRMEDYCKRALATSDALFKCGDLIERDYNTDAGMMKNIACELWKGGVVHWETAYSLYDNHAERYSFMKGTYVPKIQKYQNDYVFSAPQYIGFPVAYASIMGKLSNIDFGVASSSGGCYVATAVYGSYDCPQVWTLRRYRDFYLSKTWYGRVFVRSYYAISPTLVKKFGKDKWFVKICKHKLDHMISVLQERGYKSSPYEDRMWK